MNADHRERDESASPATPDQPTELTKDLVFGLLSVERRRQTLAYLDEHEGEATLSEVSEHIAAAENDVEECQISSTQRKRVYVALYQSHLPKLADAGVIDYDQDRGTIELGANADQLFPYLSFDPSKTTARRSGRVLPSIRRLAAMATNLTQRLTD